MRLFFAVPLPAEAADAVAEAIRPIRGLATGVSWERRTNLHITLRFLGEVDPSQVDGIAAAAAPWVRRLPPPPIVIAGGGAFPDATRPRVLWIGVSPADGLTPLAQALDRVVAPFVSGGGAPPPGAPRHEPEARPYTPHLTVGRVRVGRADRVAAELLEIGELARFTPPEVVLYESQQGPDGARYVPRHILPVA